MFEDYDEMDEYYDNIMDKDNEVIKEKMKEEKKLKMYTYKNWVVIEGVSADSIMIETTMKNFVVNTMVLEEVYGLAFEVNLYIKNILSRADLKTIKTVRANITFGEKFIEQFKWDIKNIDIPFKREDYISKTEVLKFYKINPDFLEAYINSNCDVVRKKVDLGLYNVDAIYIPKQEFEELGFEKKQIKISTVKNIKK